MENIIKIKNIELGKPDAKDEALYADSLETFCDRIILPPNFEIRNLVDKEKFYIVGNKGVGKTALLFYINNLLLKEDLHAKCSMLLFKTNMNAAKRASMDKFEKIRINSMNITDDELIYVRDFSKLWTLVIYKKIVQDNEKFDIFENNTNWSSFKNLILKLDDSQSEVLKFANEIPENNVCYDVKQNAYIGKKISYPKDEGSYALNNFYDAIEFADKLFCSLTMKEHKYYICIDELEAYNGNHDIYIRDLTMIRDLIITTKRINSLLRANHIKNIKIILSVRTEMVNSIIRELPGLEYNKDLGGFAEKINWSGPIVNFVYHPLTAIWIKRIQKSLDENGKKYDARTIYANMFPDIIGIDRTIEYIIERTWYKPRDIVRLMACLYEKVNENAYFYESNYFIEAMAEYSRQSKEELVEELGAIYSNVEIEKIFASLTAYKKHFTKKELVFRLQKQVVSNYSKLEPEKIIENLYRIGVIGLRNFSTGDELWGFLGQPEVEDEEWRFVVHRGLWRELKLEREAYEGIPYIEIIGRSYECSVEELDNNYLKVFFHHEEKRLCGRIHAKNITGEYVNLKNYLGKTINAFVIGYDVKRKVWEFSNIFKKVL